MKYERGFPMRPDVRPSPPIIPVVRDTTKKRDSAKASLFCSLASKKSHKDDPKR